jgi:predicted secreted protein
MIKNGSDIILLLDLQPVSAATSNDLTLTSEMLDVTNKDTQGWRKVLPAKKSFNCSIDGFILPVTNLLKASENLSNSVWVKDTGTNVVANIENDLFGKKTADSIVYGSGTFVEQTIPCLPNTLYTFSLGLRGSSDVEIEVEDDDGAYTATTENLTTTTTRYSYQLTTAPLATTLTVRIKKNGASVVFVSNTMVNEGGLKPYERSGYSLGDLFVMQDNKTLLNLQITSQKNADKYYAGSGYISNITQGAPVEDTITYSATLEGTAQLSKLTI